LNNTTFPPFLGDRSVRRRRQEIPRAIIATGFRIDDIASSTDPRCMSSQLFLSLRDSLAAQYGAAIETLRRVVEACPDDLWPVPPDGMSFFYIAYHTAFFLHFDLSAVPEPDYIPPEPFTRSEFEDATLPPRIYTQAEVLQLIDHAKVLFESSVTNMTEERAMQRFRSSWMDFSIFELHLYGMRHVQHHAAQLNLILRQRTGKATRWVSGRR